MTTDPQRDCVLEAIDAMRLVTKPKSTCMHNKLFSPRRAARRIQMGSFWLTHKRKPNRQIVQASNCGYNFPANQKFTNSDVGMGKEKHWDYNKRAYVPTKNPTRWIWCDEDELTPDGRKYDLIDVAHAHAHQIAQTHEHNGAFAKALLDLVSSQGYAVNRKGPLRKQLIAIYKDNDVVYHVE